MHKTLSVLALCIAMLLPGRFFAICAAEPDLRQLSIDLPEIKEFQEALLAGPKDSFEGLANLMASKMFAGAEAIKKTVLESGRQHEIYLSMFGSCTGVDIYRDVREGPFRSISMVFKMKEAATTWTFNFYNNGDKKWRLVSFTSDTMTAYFNANGRQFPADSDLKNKD